MIVILFGFSLGFCDMNVFFIRDVGNVIGDVSWWNVCGIMRLL